MKNISIEYYLKRLMVAFFLLLFFTSTLQAFDSRREKIIRIRMQQIQHGENWGVRINGVKGILDVVNFSKSEHRALARQQIQIAKDVLVFSATKDEHHNVRALAALVLGHTHDTSVINTLLHTIKDRNEWVREHSLRGLGQFIEYKQSSLSQQEKSLIIASLISSLEDKGMMVRFYAVRFLGLIPEKVVIPHLIKALGDKIEDVRGKAAISLGLIGDATVLSNLVLLLNDTKPVVREKAVLGIAFIKRPELFSRLKARYMNSISGGESTSSLAAIIDTLLNSLKKVKAMDSDASMIVTAIKEMQENFPLPRLARE